MASSSSSSDGEQSGTGSLGFERQLWTTADLLRSNLDPGEYKHVVLGLVFLKYISDAFRSSVDQGAEASALEDRARFARAGVFWVPPAARWDALRRHAAGPELGARLDAAMDALERSNPALVGVLPRVYARSTLHGRSLGALVELISGIGLGPRTQRAKDTLGRVYEYFLSRFASAEGKGGGEFYTPTCVVRVMVEMLEPFEGRVYDPCCGSGGMFVQSLRFVEAHGGRRDAVTVYGQESNRTTWRLARMNMVIRGISARLGSRHADSFHEDLHPELRADYVLANPPFNSSKWGAAQLEGDPRWRLGAPHDANANFAWLQHVLHHLADRGAAAVVLANGSLSSNHAGGLAMRRALIKADVVDAIVWLPSQLFYSTQIAVCVWILRKGRRAEGRRGRAGQVLFIDARHLGQLEDRTHRVLSEDDIHAIASAYRGWLRDATAGRVPGLAAPADAATIARHNYALVPGRYVPFARAQRPRWDVQVARELLAQVQTRRDATAAMTRRALDQVAEVLRG